VFRGLVDGDGLLVGFVGVGVGVDVDVDVGAEVEDMRKD
jgi:hypothetical protein